MQCFYIEQSLRCREVATYIVLILSYTVGQNKNNWFLPVLGQARLFWMNLTGSTCQMPIYTMYTYYETIQSKSTAITYKEICERQDNQGSH